MRSKQNTTVEECRRRYSFVHCLWYQMEEVPYQVHQVLVHPDERRKANECHSKHITFQGFQIYSDVGFSIEESKFFLKHFKQVWIMEQTKCDRRHEQFRRIFIKPFNLYLLVNMLLFSVSCKHVLSHVFLWRRSFKKVLMRGGGVLF